MAPKRTTRSTPVTTTPAPTATTTTSVTNAQLQAMIDQGVTAALAARDANRNGDDNHTSGTGGRRTERIVRECTYQDFMKCKPLYFKGTKGVVELISIVSKGWRCFPHKQTALHDVAYAMTWADLRKKMTDKYCPRNEMKKLEAELWNLKVKGTDVIGYNQRFQELALLCVRMFPEESDKIERYVGGLPDMIHGNIVASKPKTMQEAVEMATELMDKKVSTIAERQAENKRKFENTSRNNQNQQQQNKEAKQWQGLYAGTGKEGAPHTGDLKPYAFKGKLSPDEGIRHETSTARTPEQNGVVERRNRTLVEAARTMLSAAKVPLFFWAEAIATACFTQNRSLVIPRHEKTPYHIINARKPSVKFFHIFGSLCYIVRDGENLDKMKEKGDACIFVGYSTQSKAYRVFNKRTRMIVTIHVNFDELPQMASDHVSSDPGPQCSTTVLEQDSLSPGPQSQENVPQIAETVTTSNELELLYSPMFSELLNGTSPVVSKSSATDVADPTSKNILSTHQTPTQVPTVTAPENIIQAETNTENAQFDDDEFINIFSTPVQEQGETSSRHVDSSNMHTFYQHHPSAQRWTKDHPLEQVIGNPSQSVRTRRQLETECRYVVCRTHRDSN
ncbi:retrovirus-related pol polyprotein from transposon TNT 1-94 [Tanacetum coccineum]